MPCRTTAIARRLPAGVRPILLTWSQALRLARREGFFVEYLPSLQYLRSEVRPWNALFLRRLHELIEAYAPGVIVYDGVQPHEAFDSVGRSHPGIFRVWCRRAMWRAGQAAQNVEGARFMMRAAQAAGVGKIVYTSSIAAIGVAGKGAMATEQTPFRSWAFASDYILSKYISHLVVKGMVNEGLPVTIAMPGLPFGPGDRAPTPTGTMILVGDGLHNFLDTMPGIENVSVSINQQMGGPATIEVLAWGQDLDEEALAAEIRRQIPELAAADISCETLTGTLVEESIIVALVCIVFLFHFRSALVAIISILISMLIPVYRTAQAKIESLTSCGVRVAESPADIGKAMAASLGVEATMIA